MTTPFHAGERAVQTRAAVPPEWREKATHFILPEISDRHRGFLGSVGLLFTALLDPAGRPWATPIVGGPGIALAQSPSDLVLARAPDLVGPLELDTAPDAPIGLLGIDLLTRQRVRINGRIRAHEPDGLAVAVDQAFGNCPQYIQSRAFDEQPSGRAPRAVRADPDSKAIRRIMDGADTFFIASRAPDARRSGIDISHRGGRPGFMRMHGQNALSFPDFRGNRFFNTLGNIEADGRVGIFVPDFATGSAAIVTGRATIDWTSDRIDAFDGAERIVDVIFEEAWHVADALPAPARLIEMSPALERTGRWVLRETGRNDRPEWPGTDAPDMPRPAGDGSATSRSDHDAGVQSGPAHSDHTAHAI